MEDLVLFDISKDWIIQSSAYKNTDWTYRTDWQLGYNNFDTCEELMKYILLSFDDEKWFYFNY